MASGSSSSGRRRCYDVFLSFRGEDTRDNFTDHLYTHLLRRGISTFRDDRLRRGEDIQPELLKAIEESRSAIVIFSKNYGDSRWCLEELAKIMECRHEYGQIVLPIFYHVDPSDVRKQKGSFGEAFIKCEENWRKGKVERWREALTEAANISGWHVNQGYESEHIKEITSTIANRILSCKLMFVEDNLVGMDSHFKKLSLGLSMESNDVRMIGICGIGGIGKTTIARYVYNQISWGFEYSIFLEKVNEVHKSKGLLSLQNQLLNDLQDGGNKKISNVCEGAYIIRNSLRFLKALIVFDDIDHDMDLSEFLVGNHDWYGKGSRIIITTRDKHLLTTLKVDYVYEVEELCSDEALKLFSQHAFRLNLLKKEDFVDLLDRVIHYCQGLPLALKVLGSLLCDKTISEWESELHKLENEPESKIQNVLKISFDGLDATQKAVFLDVACFFEGEDKVFTSKILDGCKLFGEINVRVLWERCLITISENRIHMHDLIQKMGWKIVQEKYPGEPRKWSRLWNPTDIYSAFVSKKGMKNVETISLNLSVSKHIWFSTEIFDQMKKAFAKMKKLRLLKVYYDDHYSLMTKECQTSLPDNFEFPHELRYLHWEGLESLPSSFDAENLVAINLRGSNIKKLWKVKKRCEKLKFVDVSDSRQLIKMPNFSSMPNLERLNFEGCRSLHKLHSSMVAFPRMQFLKELHLSDTGLEELPSSIRTLSSLEILDLSRCSKFHTFPDIFANMKRLRELCLSETRIKELPSSIGYLESLESINLSGCSALENFPEMVNMKCLKELLLSETALTELPNSIGCLESLETIALNDCPKFEKFPEIQGNMKCLRSLYLYNTAIKELPNSIGCLESLEVMSLRSCSKFEKFPEIQGNVKCLRSLHLDSTAIKELPNSIGYLEALEELYLENTAIKELPNNIGCLEALRDLRVDGCSNLEKFPEIQRNMGSLSDLSITDTAIRELPHSISRLTALQCLNLKNCKYLKNLPGSICGMKSLQQFSLDGCSNLEGFWEIIEKMENLQVLRLREMAAITEVPSSIEGLKDLQTLELSNCENLVTLPNNIGNLTCLQTLELSNCENLVTLPNSIGNLTCLDSLLVYNCPKLQKLSDSLRSLHCCLESLDVSDCNLMEGQIPNDLWCLSSLKYLDVSANHIRRMPTGIIQLSELKYLYMNHCSMLEEIPELPSSLRDTQAYGCPCLKTFTCDPTTDLLWSSLVNSFKLDAENRECRGISCMGYDGISVVVPGSRGIPEWVSDKMMGCEVRIELPKKWYKDDSFLGFALFFHFAIHSTDESNLRNDYPPDCVLSVSDGDKSILVNNLQLNFMIRAYNRGSSTDPGLRVYFFPQAGILDEYRSTRWKSFRACCDRSSFLYCDDKSIKVESCGIHPIYDQPQDDDGDDNHHLNKRSRNDHNHQEEEEYSCNKRLRHHV